MMDTIIFQHGAPFRWLFTSEQTGVRPHHHGNMNKNHIILISHLFVTHIFLCFLGGLEKEEL
jgi:hypothetical protein